ncbi:unnamed protein product [Brachionus calyciflorus]|uniref:Septin n=1 Tax=Brachionus calyciflorus TaxID=104777 RepID=A0A813T5F0_9BILA|nr:unnamed protein product [Brachionus calyciflorus]
MACTISNKNHESYNRIQASEAFPKYNLNGSNENERILKLKGYVGFEKLAHQYVNKIVKEGISFNILCIGETGIGKSTLMDTLFNTNLSSSTSTHCLENVDLKSNTFELSEKNVNLKLTIIETCGYGDQIDKSNSHQEILNYLDKQYESFLQEELSLNRNIHQINDKLVHLCLYFISPTGHSLKAIDLNTMKALDSKVNIIPIIAKADTICKNELLHFKQRIMNEIFKNSINIYQFPTNENDSCVNNQNLIANSLYPLAVIGSNEIVKFGNKQVRGRQYEWGIVSIENESHCDFVKLREMILSTNMFDLIEITHTKHYQTFRATRYIELGFCDNENFDPDKKNKCRILRTIKDVYCAKKLDLDEEMHLKELQFKDKFIKKVKEKELIIKEMEKNLNSKFNQWKIEQDEWRHRIEFKRRELDDQMREFTERKFCLDKLKLSTLSSVKNLKKK